MASLFGVDPEKFSFPRKTPLMAKIAAHLNAEAVGLEVIIRPMVGTGGKLWTCGRPGQTRHVGVSPEAAYRSWSRMQ